MPALRSLATVVALGLTVALPYANAQVATPAGLVSPSWIFGFKMTTDSGGGAKPSTMQMTQYLAPRIMRMDMVVPPTAAAAMAGVGGMRMIINDADSTMTMLMPGVHMAMIMGTQMLVGLKDMGLSIDVTGAKRDVADLGPGEKILGHPTHKYRLTTSGTVSYSFGGDKCARTQETVTEMWIAPDIDMESLEQSMAQHFAGLGGFMDQFKQIAGDMTSMPKGAPLRSVGRITDPAHPGRVVTSTMEVTALSTGAIPDSTFAIGPDYQKMDVRSMMTPEMTAQIKSQMAGSSPKCGADAVKTP